MDNHFQKEKYQIVRNALPKSWCDIVVNYAKFQAFYDFTTEKDQVAQVKNTHSRYADFLMESILLHLQPLIEQEINQALLPSYSYYRVYKEGDCLAPHVDRNACEVSATLAFGWPDADPWSFKLSNDKNYTVDHPEALIPSADDATIIINLNPGDMLIYAGPKVKHWRDRLTSHAYVQAFFHYVYKEGPNQKNQYDGRDAIGVPKLSPAFEYVKYSDWMNALLNYLNYKGDIALK